MYGAIINASLVSITIDDKNLKKGLRIETGQWYCGHEQQSI